MLQSSRSLRKPRNTGVKIAFFRKKSNRIDDATVAKAQPVHFRPAPFRQAGPFSVSRPAQRFAARSAGRFSAGLFAHGHYFARFVDVRADNPYKIQSARNRLAVCIPAVPLVNMLALFHAAGMQNLQHIAVERHNDNA